MVVLLEYACNNNFVQYDLQQLVCTYIYLYIVDKHPALVLLELYESSIASAFFLSPYLAGIQTLPLGNHGDARRHTNHKLAKFSFNS